ncbi:MAG: xanthine dehydrogenase family protein molybdopterin-binding subunit [Desulfohalobiaceae bacterium]
MRDENKGRYYVQGIPVPETPEEEQQLEQWEDTRFIGESIPRVDGYERVSGSAVYPSDVVLPGMLYGAILRCPHPHARVKRIDATAAEKLPGVRAVLTRNSPEADLSWSHGSHPQKLFEDRCRYEGEAVAAVAADHPDRAMDGLRAIEVEYEVLPFVAEMDESLQSGAASVHSGGNTADSDTYERGDPEQGFSRSDTALQQDYTTAAELHTPLELHGCVVNWEGSGLTVWESTQGVFAVQSQLAEVLDMPLSRVRVIGHYLGGGFGSKLETGKYSILAALLAKRTGKPVKMFLTREETYLTCGNRPPSSMRLKAGAKKDGTLTALQFTCTGTGGAYPAGGIALMDWLVRDQYACPNVRTECTDVFINSGPARPFRAPGHPQCSWALEQMLDELAEEIDMDPVDFRLQNIPRQSQARSGNPKYSSTGLEECIRRGAEAFEWKKTRQRAEEASQGSPIKRGAGMAACLWFAGDGGPPATVILRLYSDGSVNLNMGASDIGTGTKTVMALVVSEELGIRPEYIQIEHADTATTQYATPSGGSKTVPTESPAVRAAAIKIKRQLLDMAADDLGAEPSLLRFQGDRILAHGEPSRSIPLTGISGLRRRGVLVGVGHRAPNPDNVAINPFAAQFCEVEVNTNTGEVGILRFLGAHESGRVMDRLTYDNQVYGGITMGIGLGTTEHRILDSGQTGKLVNRNWHDYKLPTALDVPADKTSLPIEMVDELANSTGSKGLGEPVTIPTAAAIANAVYHATGVRVYDSPINPLRLSELLAER